MLRLTRPLVVVSLVVLAALAASACSAAASPAATVNGVAISHDDVTGELRAIGDNPRFRAAVEASGTQVVGASDGTYAATFAAQVLTRQVLFELVDQELASRGVVVEAADLEQARGQVAEQVGGQAVFGGFPESYQETLVERNAEVRALQEELAALPPEGPEQVREYFQDNREEFEEACARHILVEVPSDAGDEERAAAREEAAELRRRIEGGADFGAVAREASDDPGSADAGGELGCRQRGSYLPEFDDAVFSLPVGELSDPVETAFGFHVVEVTEREVPSFDEVAEEVRGAMQQAGTEALQAWLEEATAEADIEVNPRWGRWDTTVAPQVVPPERPTPSTSVPPAELVP